MSDLYYINTKSILPINLVHGRAYLIIISYIINTYLLRLAMTRFSGVFQVGRSSDLNIYYLFLIRVGQQAGTVLYNVIPNLHCSKLACTHTQSPLLTIDPNPITWPHPTLKHHD